MNLGKVKFPNEDSVTFDDKKCSYHSKSYYCQKKKLYVDPKPGSPASCKCVGVTLAGKYSAGNTLVKCEECIDVSKSIQKNSCPIGFKIFSPRSREDWKTFIISANALRAPNWIIDITRPQNGCGGCTNYPMNSKVANQATWKTSDGSAWWLRSEKYSQPNGPAERPYGDEGPNGDYTANCYMDLRRRPGSEDSIQFNDRKCDYHSRSYFCQPKKKPKPPPAKPPPPPPKRLVPWTTLRKGIKEEIFYFTQGKDLPSLAKRSPSFWRHAVTVQYESKTGVWPGYRKRDNFAVRWTGFLLIMSNDEGTKCTFKLRSDDGSKLWIDKKLVINNGGLHPARNMNSRQMKLLKGQHTLRMEYFEKGGHAAFLFFWKNKATKFKFKRVTKENMGYHIEKGFREEVFYLKDPAKKNDEAAISEQSHRHHSKGHSLCAL